MVVATALLGAAQGAVLGPWAALPWLTAFTVSFDEFALANFLAGRQPTFPVYLFAQLRFARTDQWNFFTST